MDLIGRIIFPGLTPLYYLRIMSIFWLYLGVGMLNFIYVLLEKKYDSIFKFFTSLYPILLIISFVTEMSVLPSKLFLPILIIGICLPCIYGIYQIITRLLNTKNEVLSIQLKLIIAGIICSMFIALATDVFPIYLGIDFKWRLGSAITCIQAFFILPALLKYHFIAFPVGEVAFGLFTNSNEAIIAIDNKGIILRTNKKANLLFNIHPENINVNYIMDYIKDYSPYETITKKESVLVENPEIAINISQTNLRFGGFDQGKVMIIRDISERIQAENCLAKNEEKYRDLYQQAPAAYFSIGLDGTIINCNNRVKELLDYSPKQLIGKPVFQLYAKGENGLVKAKSIFEKFVNGFPIIDEEVQMETKTNKVIWASITVYPVKDVDSNIIESRSMVTNITDRKKAEEDLTLYREKLRELSSHIQNLQAGCLSALPVEQSKMHIFLLLGLAASGSEDKRHRLP